MIAVDIGDQDQISGGKSVVAALGRVDVDDLTSGLEHETRVLDRGHGEGARGGFEFLGLAGGVGGVCQRKGAKQSGEFHADIVCPPEGCALGVPELSNPVSACPEWFFVDYTYGIRSLYEDQIRRIHGEIRWICVVDDRSGKRCFCSRHSSGNQPGFRWKCTGAGLGRAAGDARTSPEVVFPLEKFTDVAVATSVIFCAVAGRE